MFYNNIYNIITKRGEFMDEVILRKILNETLDEKLKSIHNEIKDIENSIQEVESVNAARYVELMNSIKDLRKDLRKDITNVEIITSSNWNNIAKIKLVK